MELPDEVQALLAKCKHWEMQVSEKVLQILIKLYNGEELTRTELSLDVSPLEVAAIWSVTNNTPIDPRYVRDVRRNRGLEPSKEWGSGAAYRCLFKVRAIKDIKVGHQRGRPRKQEVSEA